MRSRNSHSSRHASRRPPASGRKPLSPLPAHTVEASAEALLAFHRRFETCFRRREQRHWSLFYLCGQLSNLERKTLEAMVLNLRSAEVGAVRDLERFMGEGRWNQPRMIQQQQVIAAEWLGEPDGVVIADGSGFPKQGDHSVGVGYQYCGHLGKVANCQQGVFLVYASGRGHAFLDAQLYLPEDWFTQAYQARWQACRIPAEVSFRTEPQIALGMIAQLLQRAVVPFRWVTADKTYGKSPIFLDGIEQLGKWFLVEVPTDTRVWLRTPAIEPPGQGLLGRPRTRPRVARSAAAPREVKQLAVNLPKSHWIRRVIKQGSKGPLVAEFAFLRATTLRDTLPGPRVWVVFRRTLGPTHELKVYFSNAPTTCPRSELIRVSGMRWPVETALEDGKGEVGMDHYETRTWPAWHRHMAHTALAHLFLVGLCVQWQKKSGFDPAPSPPVDRAGHRGCRPTLTRRARHRALSAMPQSRGLSFASQAHLEAAQPAS
jgi:SRSO17 transposase